MNAGRLCIVHSFFQKSGKVGCGRISCPLRRGNAEMDARASCGRPPQILEVAWVSQFITPLQWQGADQPTVGCNAIFRCTCRGINSVVTQFISLRLCTRWRWRGIRFGEASHFGPSSPRREQVAEREGRFWRCRPTLID